MNINQVIKYPILSEKTYAQMQMSRVYTFVVDPRTNKIEIKKAVELIFDVKVARVNIIRYDRQPKRLGKYQGFTNQIKKAIITLREGEINIFPDEQSSKGIKAASAESTDAKDVAPAEPTELEKRAAAKIAAKAQEVSKTTETPVEKTTSKTAEHKVSSSSKQSSTKTVAIKTGAKKADATEHADDKKHAKLDKGEGEEGK